MAQQKHRYYPKRQIVNMSLVSEPEFAERIVLCIPNFAWRVARAFLSEQAQWESTYSVDFQTGYYLSPDEETMDKIKESIDLALGEDDMSCDIAAAIDNLAASLVAEMGDNNSDIVAQLEALVAKACSTTGGGSNGAGETDAPPIDYEDDGSNYPDDFEDRTEFVAWKCDVATLIIDQFLQDVLWFKNTDVSGITATILVATLLTPIPGDEIAVMVGAIAVMVIEGVIDTILDNIYADLVADRDDLICDLYVSISTNDAISAMEDWIASKLSGLEQTFMGWFIHSDVMNWLFSKPNLLLPEGDCSTCNTGCVGTVNIGTGTMNCDLWDQSTISSVLFTSAYGDLYGIYITLPSTKQLRLDSVTGYTGGTDPNYEDDIRVYAGAPGASSLLWSQAELPGTYPFTYPEEGQGYVLHSTTAFTATFTVIPST